MSEPLKRQLAEVSRRLHAAGWVANHDGNASARLADGKRFLATPTAVSKRLVDAHDVLTVDIDGKVLSGRKRLFSEWHLHAAAYRARPDVGAVLHAHPPHATAVGVAKKQLGVPALPEMVVSLGANIPTIDFALPKSAAQDAALARALGDGDADAALFAGNGALTVGVDLEQAWLRLELVEHYARILVAAAALGGPASLPPEAVKTLLDARTKAGLGKAARS